MLDLARACPHVDHPCLGNPEPVGVWERERHEGYFRLLGGVGVSGRYSESWRIGWEEGERGVIWYRKYSRPNGSSMAWRRIDGDDIPALVLIHYGPPILIALLVFINDVITQIYVVVCISLAVMDNDGRHR
jgi:hypothetical protein